MEAEKTIRMPKCGCGGKAEFKYSSGGFHTYVVVNCTKCGHDSRRDGYMRGLAPLGFGKSSHAPQNDQKEALEAWKETRLLAPTTKGDTTQV